MLKRTAAMGRGAPATAVWALGMSSALAVAAAWWLLVPVAVAPQGIVAAAESAAVAPQGIVAAAESAAVAPQGPVPAAESAAVVGQDVGPEPAPAEPEQAQPSDESTDTEPLPVDPPGPTATPAPLDLAAARPLGFLMPDSEVVWGATLYRADTEAMVAEFGGFLASYSEAVGAEVLSGAEIVRRVGDAYSVGPRVLLALLELRSGWLTNPAPSVRRAPLGGEVDGLHAALSDIADRLNAAYYGHRWREQRTVALADDQAVTVPEVNAGTFAVLSVLGADDTAETWAGLEPSSRFFAAWTQLFGEPYAFQTVTTLPDGLTAPAIELPFGPGELWYYVAGPRPPWGEGAAWAAVDFAPPPAEDFGCAPSPYWVTAVAGGFVVSSSPLGVVVDLDDDQFAGSGWTHVYRHLSSFERVTAGTRVRAGDRLGHPSCEGGAAAPARVSFARRYNGEWIPADHPTAPLLLGGWVALRGAESGTGELLRPGVAPRRPGPAKVPGINGVTRP